MSAPETMRELFWERSCWRAGDDVQARWRIARTVAFALFVAVNLVFLLFHEPWQDEAQAWLLVSNLDLPSLFAQLKIEGHPALWYLILFPFAKLGCPVGVMGFISLAAVSAAAYILLARSPFPVGVQVLLIASTLFTYYLPVISRSYAVALLLVVALSALYRDRTQHPVAFGVLIALMFQTHVVLAGLGLGLAVILAIDAVQAKGASAKARIAAGIAIALAGMVATYLELRGGPSSGTSAASIIASIAADPGAIAHEAADDFLSNLSVFGTMPTVAGLVLVACAFAAVFIPLFANPRRCWRAAFLAIMGIGAQLAVSVFFYASAQQRALLFWAVLLMMAWAVLEDTGDGAPATGEVPALEPNRSRRLTAVRASALTMLLVFSVLTIPFIWKMGISDILEPYSGSTDMGACIEQEVEPGSVIVSGFASATEAVVPYAPSVVFWNPSAQVTFTYCDWGSTWEQVQIWDQTLSFDEMRARYKAAYPEATTMYLLACPRNDETSDMAPYLVYEQESTLYWEEQFRLYKIPV